MSGASSSWAARFARARVLDWTLLVVGGLPFAAASDREAEIASDLWEQSAAADARGGSGTRLGLAILLRAARGAGADLSWRRAVRRERAARPWVALGESAVFDQTSGALDTLDPEPSAVDETAMALFAMGLISNAASVGVLGGGTF